MDSFVIDSFDLKSELAWRLWEIGLIGAFIPTSFELLVLEHEQKVSLFHFKSLSVWKFFVETTTEVETTIGALKGPWYT